MILIFPNHRREKIISDPDDEARIPAHLLHLLKNISSSIP